MDVEDWIWPLDGVCPPEEDDEDDEGDGFRHISQAYIVEWIWEDEEEE